MGGLVQEMQPSSLYPQDFILYINSKQASFEAYQDLLTKCGGTKITDLFKAVVALVENEEAPDELERIRAGLIFMDDKVPEIVEHECYRIEKAVRQLIPTAWSEDPVQACQSNLREMAKEIEDKILSKLDEKYALQNELKKKVIENVSKVRESRLQEHPNIATLLAEQNFCTDAIAMLLRLSNSGKREHSQAIGSIVQDFRKLIADHGFHIGSRVDGLKQPYVGGDQELDIIEAAMLAGADYLYLFVLHIEKISKEDGTELPGEDEYYFMCPSHDLI